MRSDPPDSLSSQAHSAPSAGHPSASPDRLAFVADTLRALAVLTSLQREVLTLSYFAGLTQDEVADRLEMPVARVRTCAAEGLSRMAETMQSRQGRSRVAGC